MGVGWGYTGFTLSVCPSVRPSVRPSVDRIVSALYLPKHYTDLFHIYTSYQPTSEGVSRVKFIEKLQILVFWHFLKFVSLTLSCFHVMWMLKLIPQLSKSSYLPISVNDWPISENDWPILVNQVYLPISVIHFPISVNSLIYRYR